MKINQKFYIWITCAVIGINICWQLLEFLLYGEIQHRIVDDIISVFWIIAICHAYRFKEIELKKYHKIHINYDKWWLRKPYSEEVSDYIWLPSEQELGCKINSESIRKDKNFENTT